MEGDGGFCLVFLFFKYNLGYGLVRKKKKETQAVTQLDYQGEHQTEEAQPHSPLPQVRKSRGRQH